MADDTTPSLARRLRRAAGLPDADAPSDAALLGRFADRRDEAAFAELVRRHGPMVLAVSRQVLGNAADADDAFQATFVVLARKPGPAARAGAVGGWLYGVARRAALKVRRGAVRRAAREAAAARPGVIGPAADPPDWLAAVEEEVGRLPDKYRLPVVLCGVGGRPRGEVAAALGLPEGTLASRLAAARRRLADRLRRRGVAVPAGVLVAATVPALAAVPPGLVDTTVRAATGTAGKVVSKLATEVTRAMLLTKLRAAALLVPAALVIGVAVAATGRAGPDEPGGTPAPPAKAEAKPDDRPAWRKDFDRVYALKDGEVLRRVAPPYPDSRIEFWKDYHQGNPRTVADCPTYFTAFRFKDGRVVGGPVQTPIKPEDGVSLSDLLGMLDFPAQMVEGNDDLLAAKVTGDFVLRAGADPKAVAAALQKVLADLGVPARLTVRDEERQVVVLKGRWASKPLDGKDKDHVELYSQALIEPGGAGSGSGRLPEFVRGLQGFVGRRVVAEVEGAPKAVSWRLNVRSPMEKDPATGKDTFAEDTEAEPVLRNVCAQTGLTFAVEARKVPVLLVEKAGK